MYSRKGKKIQVSENWIIECVTIEKGGVTTYEVNVLMATVPWEEKVEGHNNIQSKEEANNLYKLLALKYKNM